MKKPTFIYDNNFSFNSFGEKFDFLLAHSIFSLSTQSQLKQCLSEARKVMHSSSLFAATFVEGEKNYTGDKWSVWAKYRFDFIEKAVLEQGLACKKLDWPSPDMQKWILIFTPDNKADVANTEMSGNLLNVQSELNFCKEKLSKLETNPIIKLALKCNHLKKTFSYFINPITRKLSKKDQ